MGMGGRTASSAVPDEAIPRLRASGGKPVPGAKPKAATVEPLPERRPAPAEAPAGRDESGEGNGQAATAEPTAAVDAGAAAAKAVESAEAEPAAGPPGSGPPALK